jgi:hypothetical protein
VTEDTKVGTDDGHADSAVVSMYFENREHSEDRPVRTPDGGVPGGSSRDPERDDTDGKTDSHADEDQATATDDEIPTLRELAEIVRGRRGEDASGTKAERCSASEQASATDHPSTERQSSTERQPPTAEEPATKPESPADERRPSVTTESDADASRHARDPPAVELHWGEPDRIPNTGFDWVGDFGWLLRGPEAGRVKRADSLSTESTRKIVGSVGRHVEQPSGSVNEDPEAPKTTTNTVNTANTTNTTDTTRSDRHHEDTSQSLSVLRDRVETARESETGETRTVGETSRNGEFETDIETTATTETERSAETETRTTRERIEDARARTETARDRTENTRDRTETTRDRTETTRDRTETTRDRTETTRESAVDTQSTTEPPVPGEGSDESDRTAEDDEGEATGAEAANVEQTGTEPTGANPASAEPASAEPASAEPASTEPASAEPASAEPASAEPASTEPASTEPASAKPASAEARAAVEAEIATAVADASSVLVLDTKHSGGRHCNDLTRMAGGDRPDLLFVALGRTPTEQLRRWRADAAVSPRSLSVLSVGSPSGGNHGESIAGEGIECPLTVKRVGDPSDLTRVGITVSRLLGEIGDDAGRDGESRDDRDSRPVVCVDSLSEMLQYVERGRLFRFLHLLKNRIENAGATGHYHMDPAAHEREVVAVFESLFDVVVTVEEDGRLDLVSNSLDEESPE